MLKEEVGEVAKLDALKAPPVSMAEAAELGVSVYRRYYFTDFVGVAKI